MMIVKFRMGESVHEIAAEWLETSYDVGGLDNASRLTYCTRRADVAMRRLRSSDMVPTVVRLEASDPTGGAAHTVTLPARIVVDIRDAEDSQ